MKGKQFGKGITQLVQEGAIQLFRQYGTDAYILGAVGQLQLDVFEYRMKGEYNVEVVYTMIGSKFRAGSKSRMWTLPYLTREIF